MGVYEMFFDLDLLRQLETAEEAEGPCLGKLEHQLQLSPHPQLFAGALLR